MSLATIRQVRALGEPLKKYTWEIVIPDPPSVALALSFGLVLRARSTSIPGISVEGHLLSCGPFQFQIPCRKTYSRQLGVRFEEGYNWPVLPLFASWFGSIQSETLGGSLSASQLRANLWLRLLGPKLGQVPQFTQAIHAYNVYPLNVNDSPLDYSDAGLVLFDVAFGYDYWRWEAWPF
jgi:hypothetical protein